MSPWHPKHDELVIIYFNQDDQYYGLKPIGQPFNITQMFVGITTYINAVSFVQRLNEIDNYLRYMNKKD